MDIILDANIYAGDYKFSGVAFKTLFDYIRRTESRLVLPRIIREEVVCSFGRRLKRESKNFFEAHRRYNLVDIDDRQSQFRKPDIQRAMTRLRRKLMKPSENIRPLYVPEIIGVSVEEVFMRGVHRSRPASDDGEELRDVIIWLWVLHYCSSAPGNVAFVSQDSTFWNGEEPHQHIATDIRLQENRLSICRTIDEFLKKHAPAPAEVTAEWFLTHFKVSDFERESIASATRELNGMLWGAVRDVCLDSLDFVQGSLYEVAPGVQFAELRISLSLSLNNIEPMPERRGFGIDRGLGFSPQLPQNLAEQQLTLSMLIRGGLPLQSALSNNPFQSGNLRPSRMRVI
jgi:hypothetical protein